MKSMSQNCISEEFYILQVWPRISISTMLSHWRGAHSKNDPGQYHSVFTRKSCRAISQSCTSQQTWTKYCHNHQIHHLLHAVQQVTPRLELVVVVIALSSSYWHLLLRRKFRKERAKGNGTHVVSNTTFGLGLQLYVSFAVKWSEVEKLSKDHNFVLVLTASKPLALLFFPFSACRLY